MKFYYQNFIKNTVYLDDLLYFTYRANFLYFDPSTINMSKLIKELYILKDFLNIILTLRRV